MIGMVTYVNHSNNDYLISSFVNMMMVYPFPPFFLVLIIIFIFRVQWNQTLSSWWWHFWVKTCINYVTNNPIDVFRSVPQFVLVYIPVRLSKNCIGKLAKSNHCLVLYLNLLTCTFVWTFKNKNNFYQNLWLIK